MQTLKNANKVLAMLSKMDNLVRNGYKRSTEEMPETDLLVCSFQDQILREPHFCLCSAGWLQPRLLISAEFVKEPFLAKHASVL